MHILCSSIKKVKERERKGGEGRGGEGRGRPGGAGAGWGEEETESMPFGDVNGSLLRRQPRGSSVNLKTYQSGNSPEYWQALAYR